MKYNTILDYALIWENYKTQYLTWVILNFY